MAIFDVIREKHIQNLMEEMHQLTDKLVEAGWSREQVDAYVKRLLDEHDAYQPSECSDSESYATYLSDGTATAKSASRR